MQQLSPVAQAIYSGPKFLVSDTETVGFKPPPQPASGIVEIAWTELDPVTLEIKEVRCERTNPGCKIDPSASAVHGIYDGDVIDKPLVQDVFKPEGPVVIVGHNVPFDLKFMSPYIENLAGSLCTWELAKKHIRGTKNHKLQTLIAEFCLDAGDAHSAGGDVIGCVSFIKYLQDLTGMTMLEMYEAAKKPCTYHTMPFGKHAGKAMKDVPMGWMDWYMDQDPESSDRNLRLTIEQQRKLRA